VLSALPDSLLGVRDRALLLAGFCGAHSFGQRSGRLPAKSVGAMVHGSPHTDRAGVPRYEPSRAGSGEEIIG
jgi:hypothetical protein